MKSTTNLDSGAHMAGLVAIDKNSLPVDGGDRFNRLIFARSPYLLQHAENPVDWYEWGEASLSQIATHPGRIGADASPLTAILEDATHRNEVKWTDPERRRVYLWLDANVPFYGAYREPDRQAQRSGQAVAPPALQ